MEIEISGTADINVSDLLGDLFYDMESDIRSLIDEKLADFETDAYDDLGRLRSDLSRLTDDVRDMGEQRSAVETADERFVELAERIGHIETLISQLSSTFARYGYDGWS